MCVQAPKIKMKRKIRNAKYKCLRIMKSVAAYFFFFYYIRSLCARSFSISFNYYFLLRLSERETDLYRNDETKLILCALVKWRRLKTIHPTSRIQCTGIFAQSKRHTFTARKERKKKTSWAKNKTRIPNKMFAVVRENVDDTMRKCSMHDDGVRYFFFFFCPPLLFSFI